MRHILESDLNNAIAEVSFLIKCQAITLRAYGWTWYPTEQAPSSFKALKASLGDSKRIPIESNGCDTSIYGDALVNQMFRFWHDVIHLENNLPFDQASESKVAAMHLAVGREFGLSPLALEILESDTRGQVAYYFKHKQFVSNQLAFVTSCLQHGIRRACASKH